MVEIPIRGVVEGGADRESAKLRLWATDCKQAGDDEMPVAIRRNSASSLNLRQSSASAHQTLARTALGTQIPFSSPARSSLDALARPLGDQRDATTSQR
jgi:hypothetical protein